MCHHLKYHWKVECTSQLWIFFRDIGVLKIYNLISSSVIKYLKVVFEIQSTNWHLLLVCPGWLTTQCTLTFKASFEEEDNHGPVYVFAFVNLMDVARTSDVFQSCFYSSSNVSLLTFKSLNLSSVTIECVCVQSLINHFKSIIQFCLCCNLIWWHQDIKKFFIKYLLQCQLLLSLYANDLFTYSSEQMIV